MLLLDLNVRNRVDVTDNDIVTVPITIDCEHIINKSYCEYARMFETALEDVALYENMVLDIELRTADLLNADDIKQYHQNLVNLFSASILTKDRRKGIKNDNDIRIPNIENITVGIVMLRKMSLYATKINRFNVVLRCGKMIMDMTGGYYERS